MRLLALVNSDVAKSKSDSPCLLIHTTMWPREDAKLTPISQWNPQEDTYKRCSFSNVKKNVFPSKG